MATVDVHTTVQDLEAAGAGPKLAATVAEEIARAAPRNSGPTSIGILATATALGFVLITVVFGWFMPEASQQRSDLRIAIEANRDRIDAVNDRIARLDTTVSERFVRIETLLEERLPARP